MVKIEVQCRCENCRWHDSSSRCTYASMQCRMTEDDDFCKYAELPPEDLNGGELAPEDKEGDAEK